MFVNVRKMVSIFESKKQPRPLSLPPCEHTQRENEKTSLTSEPRPSLMSPAPSAVRDAGGVRRVRDSWPTGKIDYYPRANRLETSKHLPRIPSKNTISGLRTSPVPEQVCSSKPSFLCTETHIAPPAGQISENHPELSCMAGSSCVSDQKRQNHVWSSLREERGRANTHARKPRPSDSTLLSLMLFFHR